MFKNVASQKFRVFAFDVTTGLAKTGDAANLTAYVSKDYGAVTVLADTSATEESATNAPGYYLFDAAQAETNADCLMVSAKSSTANISVIGAPAVIYTRPAAFGLVAGAAGGLLIAGANAGTSFVGSGAGAGLTMQGGATGHGLELIAGATSGDAFRLTAVLGTGNAINADSSTSRFGLTVFDGGVNMSGGATQPQALLLQSIGAAAGLYISGGPTGPGVGIVGGSTSGDGINVTTTSGHGVSITATGTSKHGMVVTGGTAGTSDGIKAVAGSGGVDIRGNITGTLSGAPTAIQNADALLDRDMATGVDSGSTTVRTPRQALRVLRNKWSISGTTQTFTKEDDVTASHTAVLTGTAGADPVTASDPAGP